MVGKLERGDDEKEREKKRKKEERRKKNLDLAHSWHLIRQGYSISVSWTVSIDERRYKYCVERYKREGGGGKWKMVRDVYRRGEWQKREREREIFLRKRDDWKEGFWKMTFPRARSGWGSTWISLAKMEQDVDARDKNICVLFRVSRKISLVWKFDLIFVFQFELFSKSLIEML